MPAPPRAHPVHLNLLSGTSICPSAAALALGRVWLPSKEAVGPLQGPAAAALPAPSLPVCLCVICVVWAWGRLRLPPPSRPGLHGLGCCGLLHCVRVPVCRQPRPCSRLSCCSRANGGGTLGLVGRCTQLGGCPSLGGKAQPLGQVGRVQRAAPHAHPPTLPWEGAQFEVGCM